MRMKLEDRIVHLRNQRIEATGCAFANSFQGVTKEKVREVLSRINLAHVNKIDAAFALLDDETTSWFTHYPGKFCDGATNAHVACHVGIFQRGRTTKLDREGRDTWLKPLWEIGAIEKVTYISETRSFVAGHPKAKSGNSAYKLADSFVRILKAGPDEWPQLLDAWVAEDAKIQRLTLQAQSAAAVANSTSTPHQTLIQLATDEYLRIFLPDYEVIYVDDADGDRVSEDEVDLLAEAGIELGLADSFPDVIAWNRETRGLWIVEAVTSDGEVDNHKVEQLTRIATRSGNTLAGLTTAYLTWKEAAARQSRFKNIAVETYLWIAEDPGKHLFLTSNQV